MSTDSSVANSFVWTMMPLGDTLDSWEYRRKCEARLTTEGFLSERPQDLCPASTRCSLHC